MQTSEEKRQREETLDYVVSAVKSAEIVDQPRSVPETVILVTGVLLLGALGFSILPVLSPFVIVGGIIYLLYPLRKSILANRLMWLAILMFTIWFFYSILGLLAPFIIAFLLAYILNPIVTRFERKGLPRWLTSLLSVLLLIGAVVSVFLFVMPLAIQQFQGILAGINLIAKDVADLLKSGAIFDVLERYGIPVERAHQVITEQISPRLENLLKELFEGVFGFVTGVSSLILHLINAVIIPFLVFYMLMDFPDIMNKGKMLVPEARRVRFVELARKVDKLMGRYIRGAITVAIIQGTISAIGLWIIGVKYSIVLGIMTGILNFIPYVGLITSLVVSCIVAVFSGEPVFAKVIAVVILYLSQKLLEATVLAPKIIGSQVGLHPVVLILCLLVFGYFLGFVGLLIAVPATALILAAFQEWEASSARGKVQPQEAG